MKRLTFLLALQGVVFVSILDAIMKSIALDTFSFASSTNLSPVLDFALHQNPGITFDIPIPLWIIVPITLIILAVLLERIVRLQRSAPPIALAFSSILIGALNNLLDRIINGFTTDYFILFRTSAINLSDILIVLGAGSILMYSERNPHALRTLMQDSPSCYGFISRAIRSFIRVIRNSSHR
jgi:lipoprotein signal peptidase